VAGIDEHNRVYVSVAAKDPVEINLDYQFLHIMKIAGSAR
jgi:hypothetical protein